MGCHNVPPQPWMQCQVAGSPMLSVDFRVCETRQWVDHVLPAPIILVASLVVERPGNSRSEETCWTAGFRTFCCLGRCGGRSCMQLTISWVGVFPTPNGNPIGLWRYQDLAGRSARIYVPLEAQLQLNFACKDPIMRNEKQSTKTLGCRLS